MNARDVVDAILNEADIDPVTTEKVVGTLLSVLRHETGGDGIQSLFARLPGSLDLARKYDVMASASGGGLLGSLTGALGGMLGEKAGALVRGLSQLEATGLTADQIRQAGQALMRKAEAVAGPDAARQILDEIPGLKGHLGLG